MTVGAHGIATRMGAPVARAAAAPADDAWRMLPAVRAAVEAGELATPAALRQASHVEQVLRVGELVPGVQRTLGASGRNGPQTVVAARDGAGQIEALRKSLSQGGPDEAFGWAVAKEFGLHEHFAPTALAVDGTALQQLRGGMNFVDAKVLDAAGLERSILTWLERTRPDLSPAERQLLARMRRELLQSYDYVIANLDRHFKNGLADPAGRIAPSFVDQGQVARGEFRTAVLVPRLHPQYQGPAGELNALHPATVEYLRNRVSPERLGQHARRFGRELERVPNDWHEYNLGWVRHIRSGPFAGNVVARAAHLRQAGGYRYTAEPYAQGKLYEAAFKSGDRAAQLDALRLT